MEPLHPWPSAEFSLGHFIRKTATTSHPWPGFSKPTSPPSRRLYESDSSRSPWSNAEDRIARAGRTRTHQLDTNALAPGTSTIDFYREVQGDVGWRGPATLLRLDKDESTAVLSPHVSRTTVPGELATYSATYTWSLLGHGQSTVLRLPMAPSDGHQAFPAQGGDHRMGS